MSDRRRQEIESKRAKLAELRKARADRQRVDAEKRTSDVCTSFEQTESHIDIGFLTGNYCKYYFKERCR
jgi:dynein intermediate chain